MNNQIIFKSLLDKIDQLLELGMPFVAYKKPKENLVTLMIQQNDSLYYLKDYAQSGFVFAPFDDKGKTILFPIEKCEIYTASISDLQVNLTIKKKENNPANLNEKAKISHINLVEKGIDFIRSGNASKVVLSRKEDLPFGKIEKSELFNRLLQIYPLAFVSIWYHPKVGLWLGATPETLLITKDNTFQTMALAGTQKINESDVIWGEKEIEEQQIVTDFILKQLKDFDLKVSDPFTKKAGNLLHICTEITGKLNSNDQLKTIINKLHPTPAVCGLPKETAKSFILHNEDYKREFYAGFLGELNNRKTNNLYVNLRCMQIKGQTASLYIGGGITIDSDAKSEWEETVTKSDVMKRVLD